MPTTLKLPDHRSVCNTEITSLLSLVIFAWVCSLILNLCQVLSRFFHFSIILFEPGIPKLSTLPTAKSHSTKTSLLAHLCFAQPRMTEALWLGADLPCQLHLKLRCVCIQDRKSRSFHHQWLNLLYLIFFLKHVFLSKSLIKTPYGQDSVFLDHHLKHWEIPSCYNYSILDSLEIHLTLLFLTVLFSYKSNTLQQSVH